MVSPWSEEVIASVPSGSREDIDRAVGAARRAFESGPWPAMSLEERIGILTRLRDLLVAHTEEFAQLITDEMGCPITQSRAIQVGNPVGILEAYLDAAAEYPFRAIRHSKVGQALVTKDPVGVVAAVVPWNVPLSLTLQKAGAGARSPGARSCSSPLPRLRSTRTSSRDSSAKLGCLRALSTWFRRTARSASI